MLTFIQSSYCYSNGKNDKNVEYILKIESLFIGWKLWHKSHLYKMLTNWCLNISVKNKRMLYTLKKEFFKNMWKLCLNNSYHFSLIKPILQRSWKLKVIT